MVNGSWRRYGHRLVAGEWRLGSVMPRIEQRIIGTSLYMYATVEEARMGGRRGGSGVLVGQPYRDATAMVHLYAVTNAHVIEGGYVVARAQRRDGSVHVVDLPRDGWTGHPDGEDVAVCRIDGVLAGDSGQFQWVPREWLATEQDFGIVASRTEFPWDTGPIVAGEDTFSVARFIGYDGIEFNQPIVRFGNLSSPWIVPVNQEERGRDQDSLLVEARSLAGQSGAPVFAYRVRGYRGGGPPPVDMAVLLGVGWGHITHPQDERHEYDVEMEEPGRPTSGRYNSGIMAVVPAWRLAEVLDDTEVVAVRRKHEEHAAKHTGVEMDSTDRGR